MVLLEAGDGKNLPCLPSAFIPRYGNPDIGLVMIPGHPLLDEFPHESFCDYQFYHLIVKPKLDKVDRLTWVHLPQEGLA